MGYQTCQGRRKPMPLLVPSGKKILKLKVPIPGNRIFRKVGKLIDPTIRACVRCEPIKKYGSSRHHL